MRASRRVRLLLSATAIAILAAIVAALVVRHAQSASHAVDLARDRMLSAPAVVVDRPRSADRLIFGPHDYELIHRGHIVVWSHRTVSFQRARGRDCYRRTSLRRSLAAADEERREAREALVSDSRFGSFRFVHRDTPQTIAWSVTDERGHVSVGRLRLDRAGRPHISVEHSLPFAGEPATPTAVSRFSYPPRAPIVVPRPRC